jgi:N-acetylneuraminate lyase
MKAPRGILPAIFTPMDDRGRVNPAMLCRLIDRLFDAGVDGLYVCGTTGEGLLLTAAEREQTLDLVVEATAGRGSVLVHVGSVSTDESVRLAGHAQSAGADAISAVPPFAFGRGPDGMITHYRAIAEASSLPLYLYNIPSLTGVPMTARTFESLLELPTVRGAKFSDPDLFEEYRAITLPGAFDVFHGSDETLLYGLMMGAVGGIGMTYNFMPKLYVELHRQFAQGDCRRANALQLTASRFVKIFLDRCGENPIGMGKALMGLLGYDCGRCRPPNPSVEPDRVRGLWTALTDAGFGDWLT